MGSSDWRRVRASCDFIIYLYAFCDLAGVCVCVCVCMYIYVACTCVCAHVCQAASIGNPALFESVDNPNHRV